VLTRYSSCPRILPLPPPSARPFNRRGFTADSGLHRRTGSTPGRQERRFRARRMQRWRATAVARAFFLYPRLRRAPSTEGASQQTVGCIVGQVRLWEGKNAGSGPGECSADALQQLPAHSSSTPAFGAPLQQKGLHSRQWAASSGRFDSGKARTPVPGQANAVLTRYSSCPRILPLPPPSARPFNRRGFTPDSGLHRRAGSTPGRQERRFRARRMQC